VRIAIKKLRYALEIAGDYRAGATAQAVKALRDSQETLGRMHDIEVVNAHVHRAQAHVGTSDPVLADEFRQLVTEGEAECRTLHAQFLLQRTRLSAVADQADRLASRLLTGPRSPASGFVGPVVPGGNGTPAGGS
jgi:CHAD domain-containing protein